MLRGGIKMKKVRVVNIPQRRTMNAYLYANKVLELDNKVAALLNTGAHVVYIDECVFKARGFKMNAWSRPGENVTVEDRTDYQPCQAVCAGVCRCHQLLCYMITDFSFDGPKFVEFLHQLRASHPEGKLHLFFDNASYHTTDDALQTMEKLNMEYVRNVPYQFKYNESIEKYWALVK